MASVAFEAAAQDVWSDPAEGVSYLQRTAPGPLKMHAAVVDLSRDDLYVRATRPEERGQTTSAFSQNVGAVVAINGDWFESGFQPVGLAVGQGVHWEGTADQGWAFVACNVEKECHYGNHTVDEELHWRWHDVVGGNGWRLLVDGEIPNYPGDSFYTDRHPRSAVGTSQDGQTMYFVVVEGRRPESIGVGFAEIASFMQELGAYQALMLDGGGSSTLTINQNRVNQLPTNESGERTVANHLAILRGQPDPQCSDTPNGRYCDGSVIHTCQGGQHMGDGDCGFFGASCDITSDGVGVCTVMECINGPEQSFCESETHIRTCSYGRPGPPGDCSAFGATCEDGEDDSYCVHFLCEQGGNARWCDGDILKECIDGQPEDDVDCAAGGQICSQGACVDESQPQPDAGIPDGGHGDAGTSEQSDAGGDDEAHADAGHQGTGDVSVDTGTSEPSDGTSSTRSCSGCSTTGPVGLAPVAMLAILLLGGAVRRSRRSKQIDCPGVFGYSASPAIRK